MKYITRKRYKKNCIQGYVNIPFGTELQCRDNFLYYKGKPVCVDTSQDSFDYFVGNDDGRGLERIKLINWILDHTSVDKVKDTLLYNKVWEMIWSNKEYQKFKRSDISDRWLWYKDFYTASIEDLEKLVSDIKAVK